ncbi:MAG: LacI family DNA-binding transcriptional regulator [Acidobacteria bacterium]|nr:LacI family DNA-binding transcriptional regulator [Acidobacteriota bacterium]
MKQPTIVDVAERAGVSKSLVSLVMRDSNRVSQKSRSAVLEAARELGYRPNAAARSLVRQRSGVFGCIVSDLHNPFFADVADGIEEASATNGYRALLSSGFLDAKREASAIDTLLQLRADGLIMLGTMMTITRIKESASHIPVVVIGRKTSARTMDSVRNDDDAGAQAVVDHLFGLGHMRIAHVHAGSAGGARGRRRGYETAMERHGLGDHIRSVKGAFTEGGGFAGMQSLIDSGDLPTAVFVANDFAALGALDAIDEAGLQVPEDISVVGYDDSALSHIRRIALTTVAQPSVEMGRTAVRLLIERIREGRSDPRHIVLPPQLVVRGTSATPRV